MKYNNKMNHFLKKSFFTFDQRQMASGRDQVRSSILLMTATILKIKVRIKISHMVRKLTMEPTHFELKARTIYCETNPFMKITRLKGLACF